MSTALRLIFAILGISSAWVLVRGVVILITLGAQCGLFRGGINITGAYLFLKTFDLVFIFTLFTEIIYWGVAGISDAIVPFSISIITAIASILLAENKRYKSAWILKGVLLVLSSIIFFFTGIVMTSYGCEVISTNELIGITMLSLTAMLMIAFSLRPVKAPRSGHKNRF